MIDKCSVIRGMFVIFVVDHSSRIVLVDSLGMSVVVFVCSYDNCQCWLLVVVVCIGIPLFGVGILVLALHCLWSWSLWLVRSCIA